MLRKNLSHIHLNAPEFTPPTCIIKDEEPEIINAAHTLLAIKNTSQATSVAFQGKLLGLMSAEEAFKNPTMLF